MIKNQDLDMVYKALLFIWFYLGEPNFMYLQKEVQTYFQHFPFFSNT